LRFKLRILHLFTLNIKLVILPDRKNIHFGVSYQTTSEVELTKFICLTLSVKGGAKTRLVRTLARAWSKFFDILRISLGQNWDFAWTLNTLIFFGPAIAWHEGNRNIDWPANFSYTINSFNVYFFEYLSRKLPFRVFFLIIFLGFISLKKKSI
jgi:hypothetical protein